jgi:AcrR family transcriptional regulator
MHSLQPRVRYKERARAALRSALLRETAVRLLRHGCHDVRIDAIAGACGIAKGTAYLQFRSRSRLLGGAVQQLDQSLAETLATPPPKLAGARAMLRWTVLKAVDAQIAALALRSGNGASGNGAGADVIAWPCCQRLTPCPYGGAARSLSIIERRARAVTAPGSDAARPRDIVDLLMAVSIAKLVQPPQPPPAPAHRRYIARLFDRLLA